MAASFGIHVGNTTACLALFKDGKIDVVANDSGDRVTPTVVAFSETETTVGLGAKSEIPRNGRSTVIYNKRLLNESISELELEEAVKSSTCKIVTEEDVVKYELTLGEKACLISPEEVATHIYRKLFSIAASLETEQRAVLTVPLHFQQNSRQTVMRSADEAGFEVLQVISEPSAALLAYGVGLSKPEEEYYCLVYRLGGATMDATVMLVNSGMYTVCSTVHKSNLGGNKFTCILADFLAGEFCHRWKLDPQDSRRSMMKLRNAADTWKHILSAVNTVQCFVESLFEGVDFSYSITRARFENLISSELSEYIQPINEAIEKANLNRKLISKVIPCGGAMKMPKLQQMLKDLFPEAEILSGIAPDEVIATGAAKQASYLSRPFDPDCEYLSMEVPAVAKSVCYKISEEDGFQSIIPSMTPVPVKRSCTVSLPANWKQGCIEFYEADQNTCEAPLFLGKIDLSELITPTKVLLEISLNSLGGIHTAVTEQKTQKKFTWKLEAPEA